MPHKYTGASPQRSSDSYSHTWVYFTAVIAPTLAASERAGSLLSHLLHWPQHRANRFKLALAAVLRPVIFVGNSTQPVGELQWPSSAWEHLNFSFQEHHVIVEVTRRHCYLCPHKAAPLAGGALHTSLTLQSQRRCGRCKNRSPGVWGGSFWGTGEKREIPHYSWGGREGHSSLLLKEGVLLPLSSSHPSPPLAAVGWWAAGKSPPPSGWQQEAAGQSHPENSSWMLAWVV